MIRTRSHWDRGNIGCKGRAVRELAASIGVPVGSVDRWQRRRKARGEFDALVARLYGLSRDQVEHVFATFHRGWDYGPRLESVLGYFDALDGVE